MHPRDFKDFVSRRAKTQGYSLAPQDGRTRLTKDTSLSESAITAIATGKHRPPAGPWKNLADKLLCQHKDLLRAADILKRASGPKKRSPREVALDLCLSIKNVTLFEVIVAAFLKSEKQ
ncbi:hypothetical protein J8N05_20530 [Streptomyces sp. BH-SS-21]|uniref:Uncharacterized protein n=1 Tax=Streptomyces liliiviolaceus TaxID=2823109 RepID=A0A941B9Y5_9ACTN|nr:hypothetical protein [Streptomyces liliiviolaceus]MBQ0850558.1 hypothetical protein [Streptomyces liliiviolaceus]